MGYKLTSIAQADIREIAKYSLKNWGEVKAEQYISMLYQRFNWLNDFPQLGTNRNSIKKGVMSYQEGSHVIFYYLDNQGSIYIMRVLHKYMDFTDAYRFE